MLHMYIVLDVDNVVVKVYTLPELSILIHQLYIYMQCWAYIECELTLLLSRLSDSMFSPAGDCIYEWDFLLVRAIAT